MKHNITIIAAATSVFLLAGCASGLNSFQKQQYNTYKAKGLVVQKKNPTTGAFLGLLPGGGSFYARSYGLGVVNLLLWPASILWDPISGYDGSIAINYYATKAQVDTKRQAAIHKLDDQLMLDNITKKEYVNRKEAIEAQYSGTD